MTLINNRMPEQTLSQNTTMPVDVSIIIVSWNVAELLADCIQSIMDTVGELAVEIIVIDNNSADSTVQIIQDSFPTVTVIANQENVGFARANNQGLPLAHGRYIFFLNPDTVVKENVMTKMVDFLDKKLDVGMLGPRLIYPDGTIQKSGARLLPSLSRSLFCYSLRLCRLPVVGKWFRQKYISPYDLEISQEIEAISGAAMLARQEIIRQIGGFGETFIHTGEDVAMCYEIRHLGWQIWYMADAPIVHYEGQSSRQATVATTINGYLSILEYYRHYGGRGEATAYKLMIQFIDMPITLFITLCKLIVGKSSLETFKKQLAIARGIWFWQKKEM